MVMAEKNAVALLKYSIPAIRGKMTNGDPCKFSFPPQNPCKERSEHLASSSALNDAGMGLRTMDKFSRFT
jgi:hypothetical protein